MVDEPAPNPMAANGEMFQRITEALADLGDDKLNELIEVENKAKLITKDEVWKLYALDHYDKAIKEPGTNLLRREDARKIIGMLNQMTDESVVDEFIGMHRFLGRPVVSIGPTIVRMLHLIIQRRGLHSLVGDRERVKRLKQEVN
jgi:hypothetical protein